VIDTHSWPPLCGAVARSARGSSGGTAVQRAMRLNDVRWRVVQAVAGAAEFATGLLVCAPRPAVADVLMACQGTVFVALLTYALRKGIPGDCGCVARRRTRAPDQNAMSRWTVARAVFIALAGAAGAAVGVQPPSALPRSDEAFAWAVALGTSALLAAVDLGLRTPRCRRSFLFPVRSTLTEVTGHGIYRAMAAPLGATGERVLFRRAGCTDEFWFPAHASGQEEQRYLEIKAGRAASGALTLRAGVTDQAPPGNARIIAVTAPGRRARPAPAHPLPLPLARRHE
jgi:hypothetical protein